MHRHHRHPRQPHRCPTAWARAGGASIAAVAVAVMAISAAGVLVDGPGESAVLPSAAAPTAPAAVAEGPLDAQGGDPAVRLERQRLAATEQPLIKNLLPATGVASGPQRSAP